MPRYVLSTLCTLLFLASQAFGLAVIVHTSNGECAFLEASPQDTLEDMMDRVAEECEPTSLELFANDSGWAKDLPPGPPGSRNYLAPLTENERKDIHYIVTILANKPLAKIPLYKKSLDHAGERVDHVHPFRFLEAIFTDEELKVGVRIIKKRGWIWKEFLGGCKKGFGEEYPKGNVKEEYMIDFASIVKIDPAIIAPAIENKRWEELVNLLIQHIPRENDDDRYNQ